MTRLSRKAPAAPLRRSRADGTATRERILACAGALFAATGYAETTGKAIAAAAGVDLASINYHFGSRAGLYQAALAEAHRQLITLDLLERLERSDLSPRAKLDRLIEALVKSALAPHGWHSRVLARELLAPSSNLSVLIRQEALPKIEVITHLICQLTRIPPGDPAIARCLLNIASPCLMLFVAPSGVPGPLRALRRMPRADLVAHLQRFALAGLEAVARDYSRPTSSTLTAGSRPRRRPAAR